MPNNFPTLDGKQETLNVLKFLIKTKQANNTTGAGGGRGLSGADCLLLGSSGSLGLEAIGGIDFL